MSSCVGSLMLGVFVSRTHRSFCAPSVHRANTYGAFCRRHMFCLLRVSLTHVSLNFCRTDRARLERAIGTIEQVFGVYMGSQEAAGKQRVTASLGSVLVPGVVLALVYASNSNTSRVLRRGSRLAPVPSPELTRTLTHAYKYICIY